MVSRAASIPASRISSARTSLDGAGNSLPTACVKSFATFAAKAFWMHRFSLLQSCSYRTNAGGARSLTAPLDSQGPQSWSERHSPPLATHNSGMSAQVPQLLQPHSLVCAPL
eukprot:1103475-Pelagomonas_calceolata.AAC.3